MTETRETLTQKVQRFARDYVVGGLSEEQRCHIYDETELGKPTPKSDRAMKVSMAVNALLGMAGAMYIATVAKGVPLGILIGTPFVESAVRYGMMRDRKASSSMLVQGPLALAKGVAHGANYIAQKRRNLARAIEYDFEDTPYAERELSSTALAELIRDYNDGTQGYVRLERRSKWGNYGYCDHFQPSGSSHQTKEKENTNLGDFLQEEFGDDLERLWVPFWEPLQGTIKVRSYKSKNGKAEKHVLEMNEQWGERKGNYGLPATIVREDTKITYLVEAGQGGK